MRSCASKRRLRWSSDTNEEEHQECVVEKFIRAVYRSVPLSGAQAFMCRIAHMIFLAAISIKGSAT